MILRNATHNDFPDILKLNAEFVHFLSPMTETRLEMLHRQAIYLRVFSEADQVIAFLIAFREGAEYDSPNYRWFSERYDRFIYIDRLVIDGMHHHRGIGTQLYQDLFAFAAENRIANVFAEVDSSPPNPVSDRFHAKQGFQEVGSQFLNTTNKQVSMQMRLVDGLPNLSKQSLNQVGAVGDPDESFLPTAVREIELVRIKPKAVQNR